MKIDPNETDRIVLVASGFGVWQAGRHIASGRWGDIVRVRAFRPTDPAAGSVTIDLALRGGTEVTITPAIPGYDAFLRAAETALPGMRPRAKWGEAAKPLSATREEIVVFERARS